MTAIVRVDGWRCSDGEIFAVEAVARNYQDKLDFKAWCFENIGSGYEVEKIADAIWRAWHVSPRRVEVPQEG